jgi:DNA-binding NarL/FixJ family response regulator
MAPIPDTQPTKPRILIADDHVALQESVSRLLAGVCDVVGRAGDGREALELARHLRPDVVLLDVSMPGLGGFQTIGSLRRDLPDSRVIFLTMHRDDEFVAAAINAGAHGYVLKSRMHVDLISAIEHVVDGRLFVPSLTALRTVARSRHALIFHTGDDSLDEVSRLVAATLQADEPVAVVTCESTRTGIAEHLRRRRIDLPGLEKRGLYVAHDSALALSEVMHDGTLDRKRISASVDSLERLRRAASGDRQRRLTVVADHTISLWRNGDHETALALERIWSELTEPLPFFTVCVLPIDCYECCETAGHLPALRAAHSELVAEGPRPIGGA